MNWIKEYLKKKREKEERRKQEEFLNTKIPLNDLYICELSNIYHIEVKSEFQRIKFFEPISIKILKRLERDSYFDYIDPITKTKYRQSMNCLAKICEIVVTKTVAINFTKEVFEKQYLTIAQLIELNEEINKKLNEKK